MVKSSLRKITESVAKKQKLPVEDIERFITTLFEVADEGLHADKQVKIKGLGTFKITTVKPRESVNVNTGERVLINSHDKVSFTPDTTMKELVNKPFAQFKTVVVNDGVDITKLETSEQLQEEEQDAPSSLTEKDGEKEEAKKDMSPQQAMTAEEFTETEPQKEYSPFEAASTEAIESEEEIKAEETEVAAQSTDREIKLEPIVQANRPEPQTEEPISPSENAQIKRPKRHYWIVISLVVIVALIIATISYNSFQTAPVQPQVAMKAKPKPRPKAPQPKKVAEDPYAVKPMSEYMKDPRIKYGAYDIVGIDKIVTLKEGQTLQSICNSTLGSYMICYFEAVNPNKDLKAGDKVRIPKVKIRKRN